MTIAAAFESKHNMNRWIARQSEMGYSVSRIVPTKVDRYRLRDSGLKGHKALYKEQVVEYLVIMKIMAKAHQDEVIPGNFRQSAQDQHSNSRIVPGSSLNGSWTWKDEVAFMNKQQKKVG